MKDHTGLSGSLTLREAASHVRNLVAQIVPYGKGLGRQLWSSVPGELPAKGHPGHQASGDCSPRPTSDSNQLPLKWEVPRWALPEWLTHKTVSKTSSLLYEGKDSKKILSGIYLYKQFFLLVQQKWTQHCIKCGKLFKKHKMAFQQLSFGMICYGAKVMGTTLTDTKAFGGVLFDCWSCCLHQAILLDSLFLIPFASSESVTASFVKHLIIPDTDRSLQVFFPDERCLISDNARNKQLRIQAFSFPCIFVQKLSLAVPCALKANPGTSPSRPSSYKLLILAQLFCSHGKTDFPSL